MIENDEKLSPALSSLDNISNCSFSVNFHFHTYLLKCTSLKNLYQIYWVSWLVGSFSLGKNSEKPEKQLHY